MNQVEEALLKLLIILNKTGTGNHELLEILDRVEVGTKTVIEIADDADVLITGVNHSEEIGKYCESFLIADPQNF